MKNYIFYTSEGYTYDNLHNEADNMQILGHGVGENISEAFNHFKQNQSYLSAQAFTKVAAIQTVGEAVLNLEL